MGKDKFTSRCYSRVGLLGNPSDGYNGKVISFALKNFYCEVTIEASNNITLIPNQREDGLVHDNVDELSKSVAARGYTGGLQLLLVFPSATSVKVVKGIVEEDGPVQAACKVFRHYCTSHQLCLAEGGFTLSYTTNIPRQCGLSGSSAIILAALDCLIRFYSVGESITARVKPELALAAESELGITAGLQDRVIQTYGGLVYMDFSDQAKGENRFEALDHSRLPDLYVIYSSQPSHSGTVHSNVKQRWQQNEGTIIQDMASIARLAEAGRVALGQQDWSLLGGLMNQNFDLRRKIFGDNILGPTNLEMVSLVRSHGGCAKLTGSGGAIVALFPSERAEAIQRFDADCKQRGFKMVKAEIAPAAVNM